MKILKKVALLSSLILPLYAQASTVHFDSDFNNAVDTGSGIFDNGYFLEDRFGDPALANGQLEFNLGGNSLYEQLKLNIAAPASHKKFSIEFDLVTHNLVNSGFAFGFIFDTPTVQTLEFNNCCNNDIYTFNPLTGGKADNTFGTLVDDQSMHVNIDIDLSENLWMIDILGVGSITTAFYSENGSIGSMRMNLSAAHGSITSPDPSIYVLVDNLVVTSAVPVPASVWLFVSGLFGMIGLVKRKSVR